MFSRPVLAAEFFVMSAGLISSVFAQSPAPDAGDSAPSFGLGVAATPLNYVARLVIDPVRDDFIGFSAPEPIPVARAAMRRHRSALNYASRRARHPVSRVVWRRSRPRVEKESTLENPAVYAVGGQTASAKWGDSRFQEVPNNVDRHFARGLGQKRLENRTGAGVYPARE